MVHYPKQPKYFLLVIPLLIGIGLAGIGVNLAEPLGQQQCMQQRINPAPIRIQKCSPSAVPLC